MILRGRFDLLLLDFAIGDGQASLAERFYTPVTTTFKSPFLKNSVKIIGSDAVLDGNEDWANLFKKAFLEQAR